MNKHIVVSGLINLETTLKVDSIPITYEPMRFPFFGVHSRVAGVGFNLSKALHGLGSEVKLVSLMGRDAVGKLSQQATADLGLSTEYLLQGLDEQAQSVIAFEPSGQRMIFTDLKDIQERNYPTHRFEQALEEAALAVLCNINFSRPLLPIAKAKGVPIASDGHTIGDLEDAYNQDFMATADILFQSHEKLPVRPEIWIEQLQKRYANQVVVIGLGAKGVLLAVKGSEPMLVPAVQPRPVVNTIGAGDSLFAAFLHFYGKGLQAPDALRRAVLFAGYKVGSNGAAEGFLSEAQLERLL